MYRTTLAKLYELLEETGCSKEVTELKEKWEFLNVTDDDIEALEVNLDIDDHPEATEQPYCITEINIFFKNTVIIAVPNTDTGGWHFYWAPRNPKEKYETLN